MHSRAPKPSQCIQGGKYIQNCQRGTLFPKRIQMNKESPPELKESLHFFGEKN